MITLTKDAVFTAARRAYEAKRLSAQGPSPRCQYRDPVGLPCAVGAAIDPNELSYIDGFKLRENEIGSVGSLSFRKVFNVPTHEEERAIKDLQSSHDAWASAELLIKNTHNRDNYAKQCAARCEENFVSVLYGEEANG